MSTGHPPAANHMQALSSAHKHFYLVRQHAHAPKQRSLTNYRIMTSPSSRCTLPLEIYILIAEYLEDDCKTLSILSRTSRTLHDLLNPLLDTYLKANLKYVMGWAVSNNSAEHVKRCIDLGITLPESHEAADLLNLLFAKHCDRAIGVLLDHGMDPLAEDLNGETPMNEAVRSGDGEILKLFMEKVDRMGRKHSPPRFYTRMAIGYLPFWMYFDVEPEKRVV